jgi:outer membrane protein TolC
VTRRAVTLALALLAGCAVDQQKEVRTYRDMLDQGLNPDDDLAEKPELDVTEVMALASLRNEALAIEGESYLQSLIDRRRAAAVFLPTITLAPSYSWRDETQNGGGISGPSGGARGWNTPIEGDLSVSPVRDVASLRQAGATAEERHALLLDFQDALLIDVARAHYEVMRAERAVEVLRDSLTVQEERVSDASVRLAAGLVRPLDVTLSEAQAAQTGATLIAAQAQAKTARSELAFLAAAPLEHRGLIDTLTVPATFPEWDELTRAAEMQRQDLAAAIRRIDAAAFGVESAYGQYFPSVSLNAQWFLQRDSEPTDLDWTALIQFSLPLFSAGLIEADVREALSVLRQSKLNYSLTRRAVQRDIEVALENLRASFERVERIKVQAKSAGDALEQAEGLYAAGLGTNLERLVAQNSLLSAELDLLNAEFDTKVFYLDLLRTTGCLHELIGLRRPATPGGQLSHAAPG